MPKILVVDDNPEKLRHIIAVLKEVPGCSGDAIEIAHDGIEAKRALRQTLFDLLILDIALPNRPEDLPSPESGLELLHEVLNRDIYCQPREVVGLTAFPEIKDLASLKFAEDLWTVLQYDASSDGWAEQLKRKVRHVLITSDNPRTTEYHLNYAHTPVI